MLDEKECKEALEILKGHVSYETVDAIVCFKELIAEHFDNPPLKWEELKPNMRVWDNEMKEWIQIVHLTNFLGATKFVNFYINGLSELIDSEYEPNRFYRKEIKDVD